MSHEFIQFKGVYDYFVLFCVEYLGLFVNKNMSISLKKLLTNYFYTIMNKFQSKWQNSAPSIFKFKMSERPYILRPYIAME